jgi:hypothetical protein
MPGAGPGAQGRPHVGGAAAFSRPLPGGAALGRRCDAADAAGPAAARCRAGLPLAPRRGAGVLPGLQQLLQQQGPRSAAAKWGAQALAHLTSSQQHKQQAHRAGCLEQLLPLLRAGPVCPAAEWAARAVCNLTALPEVCTEVAASGQGTLHALAALMRPLAGDRSGSPCAVPATLAVANLARHGCFCGPPAAEAAAAVAAAVEDASCPAAALQAALTCTLQLAGNKSSRWVLARARCRTAAERGYLDGRGNAAVAPFMDGPMPGARCASRRPLCSCAPHVAAPPIGAPGTRRSALSSCWCRRRRRRPSPLQSDAVPRPLL